MKNKPKLVSQPDTQNLHNRISELEMRLAQRDQNTCSVAQRSPSKAEDLARQINDEVERVRTYELEIHELEGRMSHLKACLATCRQNRLELLRTFDAQTNEIVITKP